MSDDDTNLDLDAARARDHMRRAVLGAVSPGDPWARVQSRVASRRRHRRAMLAGTSALAVSGVLAFAAGGGVTALSATSARLIGPAGYPEGNATTSIQPTDEAFAYYTRAETVDGLLLDGPDQAILNLLDEAENLLIRDCMRAAGSDWTWPDRQDAYDAGAEERSVRQRADQRQARAFGDPAHASEHGYGIDREEWMRVVVEGSSGGDVAWPVGTLHGDNPEAASSLLFGPPDAYIQIDMGDGSVMGTPGVGCQYEAQSELYGDYVQVTRSRDRVGNSIYPQNLRALAAQFDPQLRAADVVWSSCMAGKGWRGLQDQTAAFSLVWDDYWFAGRDDAAQVERQVAVADAECVVDTGYADVLADAQDRLVGHLTTDPDIVAYGALIEDALPRAEAAVSAEAARVDLTADEKSAVPDTEAPSPETGS